MRLKYEFSVNQVCGVWCAVPVGPSASKYSGVISLNETAADMMKYLSQDITEDELVEKMLSDYDVPEAELRQDVQAFIQKLKDENVLC